MDIFKSWLVERPIAHRGFFDNVNGIPENSLLAFERSIKYNYPIELDVHVTDDGTVVVFHDYELSRMTGKDGYTVHLKAQDLSSFKLLGTDTHIPTLSETLDFIDGRVPILIEIKTATTTKTGKNEAIILEVLKNYKGEFAIQSFNPFTLEWFANNAPEITRGLLSSYWPKSNPERPKSATVRWALRNMIFAKRAKPNFISHDVISLPNRHTKKWKHIPLISWVISNQDEYIQALQVSDNAIFQDFEPQI